MAGVDWLGARSEICGEVRGRMLGKVCDKWVAETRCVAKYVATMFRAVHLS